MRAELADSLCTPRLPERAHRPPATPCPPAADRGRQVDLPPADVVVAEDVGLDERLVIAPVTGTFFPAFTEVSAEHPGIVAVGDEIGVLVQSGDKHPVLSPFAGQLMGMLAMPGERVREYQPVAWLSIA
jgi:biotin carboxyl carrier protein